MNIIVPSGIGDISWLFSKLRHVIDEIDAWFVIDGAPRRSVPYLKVCGVQEAYYDADDQKEGWRSITRGQYQMILAAELAQKIDHASSPTWEKIRKLGVQTLLLEANQHLEAGKRLEEWLPDLPTDFHYPLYVSDAEKESARKKTERVIFGDRYDKGHPMAEGPIVGISCASYKGADAWDTWGQADWVDFLKRVMEMGWRPIMVGGGWDDLTYSVACELDLPSTVGKTSVPEMIEQMDLLDAYIGFSSGMNVIRTVLNRPAMALWPCNQKCDQKELSTSWAPPKMLESGRYQAMVWRPVRDIWPVAKRFLRLCEDEQRDNSLGKEYPNRYTEDDGVTNGVR